MTSLTNEPPAAPAWYRRLPKPPTEHNHALHRTSLLSQHHIFHERPSDQGTGEDASRRSTIHVPQTSHLMDRVEPEGQQPALSNGSRSTSPSKRSRSVDMAEDHSQAESAHGSTNARDHLCLCPSEPKIPRPRNCEHAALLLPRHER
jgi:hypothetical protein